MANSTPGTDSSAAWAHYNLGASRGEIRASIAALSYRGLRTAMLSTIDRRYYASPGYSISPGQPAESTDIPKAVEAAKSAKWVARYI